MEDDPLIFRVHAVEQMFRRGITEIDVRFALEHGEVIESAPEAMPYPSRLVLAWIDHRGVRFPLHVVTSYDRESRTTFVVTVYEPSPYVWEPGFKRRKSL